MLPCWHGRSVRPTNRTCPELLHRQPLFEAGIWANLTDFEHQRSSSISPCHPQIIIFCIYPPLLKAQFHVQLIAGQTVNLDKDVFFPMTKLSQLFVRGCYLDLQKADAEYRRKKEMMTLSYITGTPGMIPTIWSVLV